MVLDGGNCSSRPTRGPLNHLVSIEVHILCRAHLDPSVFPLQEDSHPPRTEDAAERKTCTRSETDRVPGTVWLWPKVGTINVANLTSDVGHGQHHGLLLFRLRQCRRRPANNDTVDGIGANRENEASDVPPGGIESRCSDGKSDDGDRKTRSDVPGAFVETSTGPTEEDTCRTGEEERRASHDQSDGRVEAEGFYHANWNVSQKGHTSHKP